jgi:hypothetical protein
LRLPRIEIELTPKKNAGIVKPASLPDRIRGRHRIEDLAAMNKKGGDRR